MPRVPKEQLFQPKYSKKIQDFIVDKIEGGLTLEEICREYSPKYVPCKKTCNNWKKKYPEFKTAVDQAYVTLIYSFIDEINILSKKVMEKAKELRDTEGKAEYRDLAMRLKSEMDAYKLRHKTLEFLLSRIAPKLVPELKEQPKQNQLSMMPKINIINYQSRSELEISVDDQKVIENK